MVINPTIVQPGFELEINTWVTQNRIGTGHGKSEHIMYKWELRDTETCDSGYESQIIKRITAGCPTRAIKDTTEDIHFV